MSKAYNIIEAINMPVGTEFTAVTPNGDKYSTKVKKSQYNKVLDGLNFIINDFIANTKFYKIPQAVTFEEALRSGKLVKLDVDTIVDINSEPFCDEKMIISYETKLKNGEYLDMASILLVIGWNAHPEELQHIFNDKCWYIEE